MTTTVQSPEVQLYWEVRGVGPGVLLIPGTPGDGGQLDEVATALAARRTVVTYDRRGTSRSATPTGWTSTSVAEQAADAAAVIRASGAGPVLAYGTSNGAAVALELAVRHPELVRAAVLHEMPLLSVLADPAPVGALLGDVIERGMAAGGARGGLESFLRFAFGDDVVDGCAPELRDRLLANAEMVFAVELPAFQAYRPDSDALRAATVPIHVVVGADQHAPFFLEAATWLAQRCRTTVQRWPGAHGPQLTCPTDFAAALVAADTV